jgi:AAHS family benzoate transporter-like MFS transporter
LNIEDRKALSSVANNRSAYLVVALGFGALVFEGYDLIVYGAAVPALLAYQPWALTPAKVGAIGGAALLGMFLGAPLAGWLSDRFGRRRMFIGLLSFFSLMMILVAVAPTPGLFTLFRFLAGVGFGGIPPTAIAQVYEFAPDDRKVLFNSVMLSGFGIGAILAAGLSILAVGHVGFRGLFGFGALPLFTLVPLAAFLLPADPGAAARRLDSRARSTIASPWRGVLQGRAALATALFAGANFFALLLSFALNTWLPQLMRGAGYPIGSALQFLLLLDAGALLGALAGGWIADRVGGRNVVIGMFLLSAMFLASLAIPAPAIIVKLLIFATGAVAVGNQSVLFGYMAAHYPQASRATAIGATSGIGRLGAASGPLIGGLLVKAGATLHENVFVFASVAILAGIAILLIPSAPTDSTSVATPVEEIFARVPAPDTRRA